MDSFSMILLVIKLVVNCFSAVVAVVSVVMLKENVSQIRRGDIVDKEQAVGLIALPVFMIVMSVGLFIFIITRE